MNIIIFNLKKNLFTVICLLFLCCLLLFSSSNIIAATNGLKVWAFSIVPCLFPFFVATELLYYTNFITFLNKYGDSFMIKFFNLPGLAFFPLIMGTISGYPTGAKIVSTLRKNNEISKTDAEHLLAFSNNSGPLFILGTVGISIFANYKLGILLLITHILGSVFTGYVLKFFKPHSSRKFWGSKNKPFETNIGSAFLNSISKSISSILNIGGFVVFFSVIISILDKINFFYMCESITSIFNISKNCTSGLLKGILELTSGLSSLTIIGVTNLLPILAISSFLLGFGGLSVTLQVYSIISSTDLSIKKYIFGKTLHGLFSCIFTILIIVFFNIDL